MKIRVRVVRQFKIQPTEEEFSVLMDAIYEYTIGEADDRSKAVARDMRNQILEAVRLTHES